MKQDGGPFASGAVQTFRCAQTRSGGLSIKSMGDEWESSDKDPFPQKG